MISRELAEITGKRHDNVMRDIKNEIEALRENSESIFGLVKGNALIFELVNYTDAKGEKRPCYSFGRDGAMQLAEGDFPHGEFFSDSTYNDANNQDRL
jgi:Rha family phage regulatory protein